MWQQMREIIISSFPKAPGIPDDSQAYLKDVDDIYITDAYHLSIERYRVTPELIERGVSGTVRRMRKIGAKGMLWLLQRLPPSLLQVKETITAILKEPIQESRWIKITQNGTGNYSDSKRYRRAIKAADLAGYRNHQVYIGITPNSPSERGYERCQRPFCLNY